jgi:hypothetical protein
MNLTKDMRKVFMEPFHIPLHMVESAYNSPDVIQDLEFGGLAVKLFMKTSEKSSPPTTIIVLESEIEGKDSMITGVYKTFLNELNTKEEKPFEILKHIAEVFGVEMDIHGHKSKFIGQINIPVPDGANPMDFKFNNGINESFTMTQFMMLTEEKELRISFAFTIGTTTYGKWLKEKSNNR